MALQIILSIILVRYLYSHLKKAGLLFKWKSILIAGTILPIVLIVLSASIKASQPILSWIAHLQLITIICTIYLKKELHFAKPVIYALLPLIVINYITEIVSFIDKKFYKTWDNYFEVAELFTLLWLIAILIINNKQRKALEKERQKALEREKEFKITESLKAALEVQVTERTLALTLQKEELQKALDELKDTQAQLIQSEKMASLGELTAGIAHEIQNPLNFVNNFSEINAELIIEMKDEIDKGNFEEAKLLANDIADNQNKINHHGKRADAIVKGMLQHSRRSTGVKEPVNINTLADEYLRLAYHGLRAKDKMFNATMKTEYDETIGEINIIPQDIGRVILNLITNAFYATTEKQQQRIENYEPTVTIKTQKKPSSAGRGAEVLISVKDNGNGIPQKVLDKIFQPFFTTKPTGQGTGLGLSMSYDIVTKGHGGVLKALTTEGEGAEFIIKLPV